jgi:hypothetical protein
MTLAELLKTMPAPTTPSIGDPAYTKYWGREWVGNLTSSVNDTRPNAVQFDRSKKADGPHEKPIIYVGYDDKVTWDRERGMWFAPADAD